MKKWFSSPCTVFGTLRVLSALAMLLGLWTGIWLAREYPGQPGAALTAAALVSAGLWCAMWVVFIRLCTRQMGGGTAFTPENRRALGQIALCLSGMSAVLFLRAMLWEPAIPAGWMAAAWAALGGVFLTVALLAWILRRMLSSAMTLEQEQADVI